jgi:hypothetical protein
MEIKFFEIRDSATFIPAMAFRITGRDSWLAGRAGFGPNPLVILMRLEDQEAHYDSFSWRGGARTMPEAHRHIEKCWNELRDGDIIDVQFVLGETQTKKKTEQHVGEAEFYDYQFEDR